MNYHEQLWSKVLESLENRYYDNVDDENFPRPLRLRAIKYLHCGIDNLLCALGREPLNVLRRLNPYWNNLHRYEYLYDLLEDQASKNKLIELLAYRLLGYQRVKLSLDKNNLDRLKNEVALVELKDRMPVNFRDGYISKHDLKSFGYDIELYSPGAGIVIEFLLQQYRCADKVEVQAGDVVIDCGGCWGDSPLYFASKGASKVYSYEFIPSNLVVFRKNIDINSKYKDVISIVENAVWSNSDVQLRYHDSGPSSRVGDSLQYEGKTSTLSIDDLVARVIKGPVSFIKMDIEGAEVPALEGARKTIAEFGPKLAISVYHKPDDLFKIPALIKEIRNDYKFYLDYYTTVGYEIVLYGVCNKKDSAS